MPSCRRWRHHHWRYPTRSVQNCSAWPGRRLSRTAGQPGTRAPRRCSRRGERGDSSALWGRPQHRASLAPMLCRGGRRERWCHRQGTGAKVSARRRHRGRGGPCDLSRESGGRLNALDDKDARPPLGNQQGHRGAHLARPQPETLEGGELQDLE